MGKLPKRPWGRPALWCAWLGCLGVVGCQSNAGTRANAEAGQLTFTIEQLRNAANPDKRAALAALRRLGCSQVELCRLRDLCLRAHSLQVEGLTAIENARAGMSQVQSDSPAARSVQKDLLTASQRLQQAKPLLSDWVRVEGEVRRHYRLR